MDWASMHANGYPNPAPARRVRNFWMPHDVHDSAIRAAPPTLAVKTRSQPIYLSSSHPEQARHLGL